MKKEKRKKEKERRKRRIYFESPPSLHHSYLGELLKALIQVLLPSGELLVSFFGGLQKRLPRS